MIVKYQCSNCEKETENQEDIFICNICGEEICIKCNSKEHNQICKKCAFNYKDFEKALEDYVGLYVDFVSRIENDLNYMTLDNIQELIKWTFMPNETNCWYRTYDGAKIIRDIVLAHVKIKKLPINVEEKTNEN